MVPFADTAALVQTMPGVARARASHPSPKRVSHELLPHAGALRILGATSPGNHESAGKRQNTTTGKGATWLRATLQGDGLGRRPE